MNTADDFLLGGGGQSASFENLGDSVEGTITALEVTQQTDFDSGDPLYWDDAKTQPRQQLVVTLQTEERNAEIEDDDGVRKVYVKGAKKAGSRSLHDATASAVRAVKAKGLKVGGWIRYTFDGEEPPAKRGMSPRKLYSAVYRAPDMEDATGALLGTGIAGAAQQASPANNAALAAATVAAPQALPAAAPVAAPPAPPAAAVPAPPAAPAAAAPAAPPAPAPVDVARAWLTAGWPVDRAAQESGLDIAVVQVLANQQG